MNTILVIFEHILEVVLRNVADTDHVRLRIESDNLVLGPIYTPITKKDQLSVERWMEEVERKLNSNESFRLDESFPVMVEYARQPAGGCCDNVPKFLQAKLTNLKCVFRVRNDDETCLARALVLGKAYVNCKAKSKKKKSKKEKEKAMQPFYKLRYKKAQNAKTLELLAAAGLPERPCTLEDIPYFEKVN